MFQMDNEVVGYVNGKAIVLNDQGDYFYVTVPIEFVNDGETFLEQDLTPLNALPDSEQKDILNSLMSEVI